MLSFSILVSKVFNCAILGELCWLAFIVLGASQRDFKVSKSHQGSCLNQILLWLCDDDNDYDDCWINSLTGFQAFNQVIGCGSDAIIYCVLVLDSQTGFQAFGRVIGYG